MKLLNRECDIDEIGWDNAQLDKLWRYNLHYFSDLPVACGGPSATNERLLLDRWVVENPIGCGTGWEPYPLSHRIVNWIKFGLSGTTHSQDCLDSLATQVRWLTKHLEWHLLGNHLFTNAKALVFAGCYFEGADADRWLHLGLQILAREIPEQILADGGHFERSPMYHALATEDMLDLLNLCLAYPGRLSRERGDWPGMITSRIPAMLHWMAVMSHPDGDIAFFNDAARNVAPRLEALSEYAVRLGQLWPSAVPNGISLLPASGFARLQLGRAVVIADVGPIGPDYLPGHAHADTLSFELSLDGCRVLVNSGTSEYGNGAERNRQRGTEAHNTVCVSGVDSSEVWGGFRVARRAHPFGLSVASTPAELQIGCSHDGYFRLPGRPAHHRRWVLSKGALQVSDEVTTDHPARSLWHWAPGILLGEQVPVVVLLGSGKTLLLDAGGAPIKTEASSWHPEFGVVQPNRRSIIELDGGKGRVTVTWSQKAEAAD